MKSLPPPVMRLPVWRRCGAVLALAASLGFAFQSTLVMAQVSTEPDVPAQSKPKPAKPAAKKHVPKVTPTDNVADELNRREAERVTKAAVGAVPAQPADAKPVDAKPPEAKAVR